METWLVKKELARRRKESMLLGRRSSLGEDLVVREKEDCKISAGWLGYKDCRGVVKDEVER